VEIRRSALGFPKINFLPQLQPRGKKGKALTSGAVDTLKIKFIEIIWRRDRPENVIIKCA
jgi:hypothetical protein